MSSISSWSIHSCKYYTTTNIPSEIIIAASVNEVEFYFFQLVPGTAVAKTVLRLAVFAICTVQITPGRIVLFIDVDVTLMTKVNTEDLNAQPCPVVADLEAAQFCKIVICITADNSTLCSLYPK